MWGCPYDSFNSQGRHCCCRASESETKWPWPQSRLGSKSLRCDHMMVTHTWETKLDVIKIWCEEPVILQRNTRVTNHPNPLISRRNVQVGFPHTGRGREWIWRDGEQLLRQGHQAQLHQEGQCCHPYVQKQTPHLQVYSILTVQLIVTMGFIGFFFIPSVAKFSQQNPALLWVALVFSIIMMLALVCVQSIRRKSPHNLIFLGLFTLCEGWLIGNVKICKVCSK